MPVHLPGPIGFAESYRAVLLDEAAAPLPAIPQALVLDRSDTCAFSREPPGDPHNSTFYSTQKEDEGAAEIEGKGIRLPDSSRGCAYRHEFVPLYLRRNPGLAAVVGFHSHYPAVAPDVYVSRGDHLLRQGEDKVDFVSGFEFCFRQEI